MAIVKNKHVSVGFPFRFGTDGRVVMVGGTHDTPPTTRQVGESTRDGQLQILLTNPGEYPGYYQFGAGATELLFQTQRESLTGILDIRIAEQIETWDDRLRLTKIKSEFLEDGALSITIGTTLKFEGDEETVLQVELV